MVRCERPFSAQLVVTAGHGSDALDLPAPERRVELVLLLEQVGEQVAVHGWAQSRAELLHGHLHAVPTSGGDGIASVPEEADGEVVHARGAQVSDVQDAFTPQPASGSRGSHRRETR